MYYPTYPKKPGPYRRDASTHAIDRTTWTSPQLAVMAESDVPFVWTEKVDGTNIRICWDGHRVEFGGRSVKAQIPDRLAQHLEATYGTAEFEEVLEQHPSIGHRPCVIFGEGFGAGIQGAGSGYQEVQTFIGFDAMVGYGGEDDERLRWRMLPISDGLRLLDELGVPTVPQVLVAPLGEAIRRVRDGDIPSGLGHPHPEGMIGHPIVPLCDQYGQQIAVKLKRDNV